jgi:hypothetical protein
MKHSHALVSLFALGLAGVSTLPAFAQPRSVDSITCKDVMRTGDDRDVTIAFLHGFLLAKTGGANIDVEAMAAQTDAFVERCLDNPAEKAIDAMTAVKK